MTARYRLSVFIALSLPPYFISTDTFELLSPNEENFVSPTSLDYQEISWLAVLHVCRPGKPFKLIYYVANQARSSTKAISCSTQQSFLWNPKPGNGDTSQRGVERHLEKVIIHITSVCWDKWTLMQELKFNVCLSVQRTQMNHGGRNTVATVMRLNFSREV